jgi:hypothetical protein
MSCGGGDLDNDHGNQANITLDQMQRAAQAANTDVEHAADNIHHAARRYRDQQQGADAAQMNKQNMAGGNYRTGDMLGTTSAAPNRDMTTDTNRCPL